MFSIILKFEEYYKLFKHILTSKIELVLKPLEISLEKLKKHKPIIDTVSSMYE